MIAVLDYDAGNLTSVACAIRHLGREPVVTRDPDEVRRAEHVVFPGVGAAGAAMENLQHLGLDRALRDVFAAGRPILGICIGCQIIFSKSSEDGGTTCLDLLPGDVTRFRFPPDARCKVPHMGWNEVRFEGEHPVFRDIPAGSQFYFVHSYYPRPAIPDHVRGRTTYGDISFASAMAHRNLVAVQFHAEKSGPAGLTLLKNFLDWQPTQL